MIHSTRKGRLEVVCGPMFSGKSEELIRRLRRATIAKQRVAVFKPALDTRYSVEEVRSHNGTSFEAHAIEHPDEALSVIKNKSFTVIGFDEVQFFSRDIIKIICTLIDQNVRVLAAGLDLDFRGIPFGPMPTLLAIADQVTKLQSICTQCGSDAHFSQRLVNNKPAKFDDPIIMVGAQEAYDARCRTCFIIDKQPIQLWQKQP